MLVIAGGCGGTSRTEHVPECFGICSPGERNQPSQIIASTFALSAHRLFPLRCERSILGEAMKRRAFLTLLGSAVTALPAYGASAQQQIPVVGFLNSASPDSYRFNAD